jgi:glucose/arabinose dehydrogenase
MIIELRAESLESSRITANGWNHMLRQLLCCIGGLIITVGFAPSARAADPAAPNGGPARVLRGEAAVGDWTHDAPGVRRLISVSDLPAPYATKSANNGPHLVARPRDAWPRVPAGFKVEQFTTGLTNPRKIITAPNGDLFIAESGANRVKVIREGADGKPAQTEIFIDQLHQPFGLAFYPPGPNPQYLYVGNTDAVWRFPYRNGDLHASGAGQKLADLPGGGHLRGGGHWTRDVVFSPDGSKMYVSVGSHSNDNDDAAEKDRADILQFNPDGTGFRIYASGIRNAVGLAIQPATGALWMSTNERDELGDDLVPDYISHVTEGGFYGWPWYYMGDHQDPRLAGKHPELKDKVLVPDVLLQPHNASLELTFYQGKQFPAEYRGDIFAAEHGSWNKSVRAGYEVIRVPLNHGHADGVYEDFITGFVTPEGNAWGRPVGVAVEPDGSLMVSDDASKSIWRVVYTGK